MADTPFDDAAARVEDGADHRAEARRLVETMTLEEKLDCLDGDTDFWPGLHDMTRGGYHAHPWPAAVVDRLGIPGIRFADGPRGCVIDPATAFPVSMARGATFDPALEERIGEAVGAELAIHGANFTGAVCLNLLRHPAWGRAQETYGEDPHHVGEMAAAFTRGLQRHVMACMKHFALNSMENARFKVDVSVDERALHEVYLPHFRRVADEGVASTMSAYNAVNGRWCGDDPVLLTDVLRAEWGWDGFVITDFIFGLRDPIGSVGAGCDIEMPFRQQRAGVLADAVTDGRLAESTIDAAVENIVATLLRFAPVVSADPDTTRLESEAHRALARETASAATVLLSNRDVLPLTVDAVSSVAVLGRLAAVANLGDGGSSNVHPTAPVTVLDGLREAFEDQRVVHDPVDASIAADADVTVVVVGYTAADEGEYIGDGMLAEVAHLFPARDERPPGPASTEREAEPAPSVDESPASSVGTDGSASGSSFQPGGDRRSLRLSEADEALIGAAVGHSDRVIVVVMGGSAIVMPWLDEPAAVMQVWYPGAEGGRAVADVLSGAVEPGGRLPFVMVDDERHLVDFDADAECATYGLFHGQWHVDRLGVAPARPFGFGLGFTTFALDRVHLESPGRAVATVTNTGDRAGSTVVFAFAGLPGSAHERPERRLVGFKRATLEAGERASVDIELDWSQLDVRHDGGWLVESGDYELCIGFDAGSADDTLTVTR